MNSNKHLLVVNRAARSGANAERIDRALQGFKDYGVPVELLTTEPNGQTSEMVRRALDRQEFHCVVSMGGDGTLREVVQGIWDSGCRDTVTLGMLPTGTANNHGKSFSLGTSDVALERNIAIIARGHETRIDVGRLDMRDDTGQTIAGAVFIDSVGVGIGARVIHRRQIEKNRFSKNHILARAYRDKRVYTVATLQELWLAKENQNFGANIVTDGQTRSYSQLTELLIKGTRVYAGSWIVDRLSRHDDGLFEVVAFPDNRQWVTRGLVDLVGSDRLDAAMDAAGMIMPKPWRFSRLKMRLQVASGLSLPAIQVDGEIFPSATSIDVEVMARALRVIVP